MRWGLIGASTIAKEWMIDAIRANNGDICCVMSSDEARGKQFADDHGIPHAVTDLEALFTHDLDAVYISTTNEKHYDQLMAAVANGVHILCEKPLALTLDAASKMAEACDNAGLVMATNHHLRHAATHRTIRQIVQDGQLGDIHAARVFHAVYLPPHLQGWRINNPNTGAGVVLDITVHNADTLAFLLGEYPEKVTARTLNHGMAGAMMEDAAMGIWEFPSGVMAYTHEGFTLPHAKNGLELHGSDASLYAEDVMTQQPKGTITIRRDGVDTVIPTTSENLYERGVGQFVSACQGGDKPDADGWAGVRSLAVALATLTSAAKDETVSVDYGKSLGQ